ncbi:hypothetical protein Syun_017508 [Stephania yunnanensis]|uniref:Uncharacterized protein n=1 Tax=Stephania yunnanensis TaxID=152371 RepID=A0AAP0P5W9_9MAGN
MYMSDITTSEGLDRTSGHHVLTSGRVQLAQHLVPRVAGQIRYGSGSEPLGGARGRGGRRPTTTFYPKEKQKIDTMANASAMSIRARKDVLQGEGFHIAQHREMDLIIVCGRTEGEAFESSDDSLENKEKKRFEGQCNEAKSGGARLESKGREKKVELLCDELEESEHDEFEVTGQCDQNEQNGLKGDDLAKTLR